MLSTLGQAGFVANDKESIWEPTQRLSKGQIDVPAGASTLLPKLQEIYKLKLILIPAKQLASVVGMLNLAIGPVSNLQHVHAA